MFALQLAQGSAYARGCPATGGVWWRAGGMRVPAGRVVVKQVLAALRVQWTGRRCGAVVVTRVPR
ncbi:hypothetical protein GCM10022416_28800 [Actinomadura keratinilytica]|uniref:Uncharacterized protein n=1 Tax=Actinomadura keratinilytica TaxID=547461 RepID=A0ABP7YTL1_9ACTN